MFLVNSVFKIFFVLIFRVDILENIVYGVYVLVIFCYCGKILCLKMSYGMESLFWLWF